MQAPPSSHPARRSIVLIEDNPADVVLTQEAFRMLGVETPLKVYGRGQDAIGYLAGLRAEDASTLPAAILLDLHLPDMNGMDLLQAIKDELKLQKVPVLVMSHGAAPDSLTVGENGNAVAFVEKSVDFDTFVLNLDHHKALLSPPPEP